MAELLLSELCAICHIRPHKYRCPRCSVRTCSLPCVKRHKQWSQCNGTRDPATYVKRSDLTTPRGIDHDYNYLTSIERQFDSADRDANIRGIVVHNNTSTERRAWKAHGHNGPRKGEEPLRKAIEQCGVVIERAPEGMVRKKQNVTQWHKKKQAIQWTVEWIHPDGRSELGSCFENVPLCKAYATRLEPPLPTQEDEARPRKRQKKAAPKKISKEDTLVLEASSSASPCQVEAPPPTGSPATETQPAPSNTEIRPTDPLNSTESPDPKLHKQQPLVSPSPVDPPHDPTPADGGIAEPTPAQEPIMESHVPTDSGKTVPVESANGPPSSAFHFYLHAPRLPSLCHVLIPIPPEATLSKYLRNRLVLEFPTIYVKENPLHKLSNECITEEAFFMKMQEDGYRATIEAKLTGNELGEVPEEPTKGEDEVDQKKLEEVLKRDLGGNQILSGSL